MAHFENTDTNVEYNFVQVTRKSRRSSPLLYPLSVEEEACAGLLFTVRRVGLLGRNVDSEGIVVNH